MPCSRKEALVKLFCNVTCFVKYFFLFFYLFSLFVAKLFTSLFRSDDEYDDGFIYEDEEEEEEEEEQEDDDVQSVIFEQEVEEQEYGYSNIEQEQDNHLVANIINGGQGLIFVTKNSRESEPNLTSNSHNNSFSENCLFEDPIEAFEAEPFYVEDCSSTSDFSHDDIESDGIINSKKMEEIYVTGTVSNGHKNTQSREKEISNDQEPQIIINSKDTQLGCDHHHVVEQNGERRREEEEIKELESNFTKDDKFLIFAPPKSEAKKVQVLEEENENTIFEDTYTVGSTSKSSSEWRSSIRDSGTDDPFSSSSRRSCPKWESYTVYQKYDEEMMFLDRISAQKLHETESLRSFQVEPRSISQRIVYKLAHNKKQRSSERIYQNTYCELEAAYVAQICLTWEALNWNYANFQRKRASKTQPNHGCPAYVAQQFQQFQVLLQRYNENEPYERGRRPEIYARMRRIAPKLLQVPEYHDYEEEQKEEGGSSRITSESFLTILEEAIRTFMNFLKADKESHCQVLAALFKRRKRGSIDPDVIHVFKKHNKKKRLKLKDLQRPRNCLRKRKLQREEEMEILMALIDLKIVSRVLRMADITQEQLNWCEGKMSKIKVLEGKKLQRDSSPLFFPSH